MAVPKGRSRRKATGGLYKPNHKRKKRELGRHPVLTTLGKPERKIERVFGGNYKVRLKKEEYANVVIDKEKGIVKRTKILRVLENPSNREFNKKKIITKGAIIETELGKAVVTSRPGQDGVINALLIK
ncbi:MAG TPA: 30S ribosomal protein S8e [Nautiliaceae bacterium]|nr:30S ribosomal protein S8e [Nautiliaceae bacterium]